jgi:hypothetical protein
LTVTVSVPALPRVTVPVSVGLAELALRPRVVAKVVPAYWTAVNAGKSTLVAPLMVTVPVKVGFTPPKSEAKVVPAKETAEVAGMSTLVALLMVTVPVLVSEGAVTVPVNVGLASGEYSAKVALKAVPAYWTAVSAGKSTLVALLAVTVPVKVGAAAVSEPVKVGLARLAFKAKVVLKAVPAYWTAVSAGKSTLVALLMVTVPVLVSEGAVTVPVNVGLASGEYSARVVLKAVPAYWTAVSAGKSTLVALLAVTVPVKVGAAAVSEPVKVGLARFAFKPKVVLKAVPPTVTAAGKEHVTLVRSSVPVIAGLARGAYKAKVVLRAVPPKLTRLAAGRAVCALTVNKRALESPIVRLPKQLPAPVIAKLVTVVLPDCSVVVVISFAVAEPVKAGAASGALSAKLLLSAVPPTVTAAGRLTVAPVMVTAPVKVGPASGAFNASVAASVVPLSVTELAVGSAALVVTSKLGVCTVPVKLGSATLASAANKTSKEVPL